MPDRPNPLLPPGIPGAKPGGAANKPAPNKSAPGQPGKATQIQGQPGSPCLISYPSASVPLVGTVGGGCLISKTNVRAMAGGLLIGAGGLIFLVGAAVLVAAGFKKTGALDKVAAGVAFVPGAGPAMAAGVRSAARPGQRRARQAATERAQMRQMGEPRENASLRTGRGAVRETAAGTRRRRAERDNDQPPF